MRREGVQADQQRDWPQDARQYGLGNGTRQQNELQRRQQLQLRLRRRGLIFVLVFCHSKIDLNCAVDHSRLLGQSRHRPPAIY